MAIPLIIGGLAVASGLFGAKKGLDAKKNYSTAKTVVENAIYDYNNACERLESHKSSTEQRLTKLGKVRLEIESELMKRFVQAFKQVNQISYKDIELDQPSIELNAPMIESISLDSYQAADLMKDGIEAVSTGVLTGIGASGLASSIGVASTGTAIGGLSGVAATNATLAWLGGGSLASGGLGMAGGTAVLGGAIAGPLIALMGMSAASKSEKALTQAYEKGAEILGAVTQIDNGIVVLTNLTDRANELITVTSKLAKKLEISIEKVEVTLQDKNNLFVRLTQENNIAKSMFDQQSWIKKMILKLLNKVPSFDVPSPLDFNAFTAQEKSEFTLMYNIGIALYSILKVKVIEYDGSVTAESERLINGVNSIMEQSK